MTDTDTVTALYAACRREPADDTARLVLADALDEAGAADGRDRAELIRAQVELGVIGGYRRPDESVMDSSARAMRKQDLRSRESALLAAHPGWLPECPTCEGDRGVEFPAGCPTCSGTGRTGTYERGLLVLRGPRLSDVWERTVCPVCGTFRDLRRCTCCQTTVPDWTLTPWASHVAANHPDVVEVWCGGRESYHNSYGELWFDPSTDEVPPPVYTEMVTAVKRALAEGREPRVQLAGGRVLSFASKDAARLALARAVARSLYAAPGG